MDVIFCWKWSLVSLISYHFSPFEIVRVKEGRSRVSWFSDVTFCLHSISFPPFLPFFPFFQVVSLSETRYDRRRNMMMIFVEAGLFLTPSGCRYFYRLHCVLPLRLFCDRKCKTPFFTIRKILKNRAEQYWTVLNRAETDWHSQRTRDKRTEEAHGSMKWRYFAAASFTFCFSLILSLTVIDSGCLATDNSRLRNRANQNHFYCLEHREVFPSCNSFLSLFPEVLMFRPSSFLNQYTFLCSGYLFIFS